MFERERVGVEQVMNQLRAQIS